MSRNNKSPSVVKDLTSLHIPCTIIRNKPPGLPFVHKYIVMDMKQICFQLDKN